MIPVVPALVLTLAWAALSGSATPHNLVLGFLLSALALWVTRGRRGQRRRPRLWRLSLLGLVFIRELALSAWAVAVLVLRPRLALQPGIFVYPLQVESDIEITLLANLVTLTPGTLSVDVSPDRRTLFIHALDCRDPDALRRGIADSFERRIMEAFR